VADPLHLRFHKSLYDGDAVARAAARFSALGTAELGESEADWLVTVAPLRESIRERLADELGNHALFETILTRRAASR
jgi:hypothetical protein